jgi:putative ABC transport system permease protein
MFRSNLKYALRSLMKNPGFALTALLTLALGIGANTAVFSLIYGVLLKGLPYFEPDRLVVVAETLGESKIRPVSYPNFQDWQMESRTLKDLTAYSSQTFNLRLKDRTERIEGELVSENYFSLLGEVPRAGRTFLRKENDELGSHPVAVLSFGCWERRFGSDPNMIGKSLKLNGKDYTVIAIMTKGFQGFTGIAELWVPMGMFDAVNPETAQFHFLRSRDIHWHQVLGRLKKGFDLKQAGSEMQTIGASLEKAYPDANANRGIRVEQAQEFLVGDLRSPLYILVGAVAFVLLIACANVANLLLFRATERKREIAIRQALGADRMRLVRQLLTESTMLSILGGVFGLFIAAWGIELLSLLIPADVLQFTVIRINNTVLLFTIVLSMLTGIFLGLAPAIQSFRANLNVNLEEGGARTGYRSRAGNAFIVAEIALALVLMIGAGLLLKSFQQLRSASIGFNPDHLLTMRFDVPNEKYSGLNRANVAMRLLNETRQIPGVQSAGMSDTDLFLSGGIQRGFTVPERPSLTSSERDTVFFQNVSPGFFHAMQIPMISGRDFTEQDDSKSQPVAIISEAFAHFIWPYENPVGKKFKYGPADSNSPWIEVVGTVANTKFLNLNRDPFQDPVVYVPLLQSEVISSVSLVIRAQTDPGAIMMTIRAAIQRFDPDIPVYSMATVNERMAGDVAVARSYTVLLASFGVLAMLLSVVGIYGVTAYSVSRRTQEIGVRMALGAQKKDVYRMVVGKGFFLAIGGITIGLVASLLLTRVTGAMLYHVSATDGMTFLLIPVLLAAVSLTASYFPARKATGVDPVTALRHE